MTVFHPGISERVYEFGFNSEFCKKNKAIVAGCPYLPTQNQEKRLGYDVRLKIKAGASVKALYLQHKVSRFVDKRTGSNKHFYDAVGGPYFAFTLDTDQYNLIWKALQKKGREFHFCAPSFTTRKDMDTHYCADTVVDNSVWIDVAGCGAITDSDSHSIIYDGIGTQAFRFSEERVKASVSRPKVLAEDKAVKHKFDVDFLSSTYNGLFTDLKEWWPERRLRNKKSDIQEKNAMPTVLPPKRDVDSIAIGIEAIRDITANYYGVSWLVGVDE